MAKAKPSTPQDILLGYGIVSVGEQPIGLTRGGSSFSVEREVRPIEADGDKGPVKGRIVIDTETAKLTVNALETFTQSEVTKYFSGTELTANVLTSKLSFNEADYVDVKWEGKTLGGKAIVIEVKNAINMGNIELTLEDKNEVVPALEFTGTYDEADRETSTWKITFPTAGE